MVDPDVPIHVRLNKFIATQLSIGRRQADVYIERGRVHVNGLAAQLGAQINPNTDHVTVDGKLLGTQQETSFIYLLFNKPIGYICSRRQQGETPTIYSLLPAAYHHLKPVGRLDKDSSGLLLLTNDGDTAHRFMHPSFGKLKRYEVALDKPLQPIHHQFINDKGITLADGISKFQLERKRDDDDIHWTITMHEGRNRQIRRTFSALGYDVIKLNRIQFGSMTLSKLNKGSFIEISKP